MFDYQQDLYEFLHRNQNALQQRRVIIAGDVADPRIVDLCENCTFASVLVDDFRIFAQIAAAAGHEAPHKLGQCLETGKTRVYLSYEPVAGMPTDFDMALLLGNRTPKATLRLLTLIYPMLTSGAVVCTAAGNRLGGKSADNILSYLGQPFKTDGARKCTMYAVKTDGRKLSVPIETDNRVMISFNGRELKLAQHPAVFSYGRLDQGTAQLLEVLQTEISADAAFSGEALDLCCGCGSVGLALASTGSFKVNCTDCSAAAVSLTAQNAAENALEVTAHPADLFDSDSQYDCIAVNPPFHVHGRANISLGERLIREAPAHLRKNGRLYLVANNFLPYQRLLTRHFPYVTVAGKGQGFNVYRCVRG